MRGLVRRVHPVAGVLALLTTIVFWTSSVAVEVFGDPDAVVAVKQAIPWGLLVLVPALAVTGASGFRLGAGSASTRVQAKRRRMPVIAGLGIVVLVPCVLYLGLTTTAATVGTTRFVLVQVVELLAGAVNITLMSLNVRDGLALSGRFRGARSGQAGAQH